MTSPSTSGTDTAEGIDRLFLSVGTDYHRFDRIIWWLDEWLETSPLVSTVVVQRGTSVKSQYVDSVEYLQRAELIEEFERASVVICHGGPATILECRSNGIVPIVVPREQRFGEHVNDHQVDFCERLVVHGDIQLARTKDEFMRLLGMAADRGAREVAVDDGHAATSLANFETQMVELLGPRARVPSSGLAKVVSIDSRAKPIPVLFVGAVPRSGSTIIADLLNEHPCIVNVGELVHIWQRGVLDDNLCGCGEAFSECEFWTAVGDSAFGGWANVSAERMLSLQRRADRTRHIPALLSRRLPRLLGGGINQYNAVVSRILRAVVEVGGAPLIVDTSKHVSTALLLRRNPDVDLSVLHLVRDPRGVAHSWSKSVARVEVVTDDAEMDRLHPARIGLRWTWFNWAFSNLDRLRVPTTTMRYEDFVVDPSGSLDTILRFAGLDPESDSIFDRRPLVLGEGHSVSGNPRRLERGPVEIRADDRWREELDPRMRRLVARVSRPFLARYSYPKDS